jgi:hypothetical protein
LRGNGSARSLLGQGHRRRQSSTQDAVSRPDRARPDRDSARSKTRIPEALQWAPTHRDHAKCRSLRNPWNRPTARPFRQDLVGRSGAAEIGPLPSCGHKYFGHIKGLGGLERPPKTPFLLASLVRFLYPGVCFAGSGRETMRWAASMVEALDPKRGSRPPSGKIVRVQAVLQRD